MFRNHKVSKIGTTVVLAPKSEIPELSIVFLHGLGDSAEGWLDFFLYQPLFDRPYRVVLLTAPVSPVTRNNGIPMTSWFDVGPNIPDDRIYSFTEANKNADIVISTLDSERQILGQSGKLFLGGFSQGAAMSLHIGLDKISYLSGLFAFSGYLFKETSLNYPQTPILITHGKDDEVISMEQAVNSYKRISDLASHKTLYLEHLNHSIDNRVSDALISFLSS